MLSRRLNSCFYKYKLRSKFNNEMAASSLMNRIVNSLADLQHKSVDLTVTPMLGPNVESIELYMYGNILKI